MHGCCVDSADAPHAQYYAAQLFLQGNRQNLVGGAEETVVFDLVVAIEAGIIMAAILFMKRMSDVTGVESWKLVDGRDSMAASTAMVNASGSTARTVSR